MIWFFNGEQQRAKRVITLSMPSTIIVPPEDAEVIFFLLDWSFVHRQTIV